MIGTPCVGMWDYPNYHLLYGVLTFAHLEAMTEYGPSYNFKQDTVGLCSAWVQPWKLYGCTVVSN